MKASTGVTENKGTTNDVVLQISSTQEPLQERYDPKKAYSSPKSHQSTSSPKKSNLEFENPRLYTFAASPPPPSDIARPSPAQSPSQRPPKIPTTQSLTQRKSFARSEFSKPKSRLVEPPNPNEAYLKEQKKTEGVGSSFSNSKSPNVGSPNNNISVATAKDNLQSTPITPKTPLIGSPWPEEDEDDDVYKTANLKASKTTMGKKWKLLALIEFVVFVCIVGLLVSSLTIDGMQHRAIWGLELWKWCVLALVILCGRLVTEWFINIIVFLIERNFLLKKKVLYFVYGLKKSVQACIWLGLILVTWALLFNHGVKRTRYATKILNYITRVLASCLIGAFIWLFKTLLVKLLASSYHVTRFFDRIQESIFHQYVLRVLSGHPVMEMNERVGSSKTMSGQLSFKNVKENKEKKEEVINVDKLKKIKHEKVSAWTMKGLIDVISSTGLSTLSSTLDRCDDEEGEQTDEEITSEWEAKDAAYRIFENVAKPNSKYIDEEDLLRFMTKEEVDNVIPLFEGAAETRKIKRSALKKWLVDVYNERKFLAHSLNDTKTAIEELNKLLSGIILIVIIIVWLLLMGFLTTQVLVFISSQILLVGFVFNNTAKTIFEAIIFVFVMHPFDVGGRCVIDGVQMVVEEMNLLTTIFLRYDNEKIFYPNSVLSTKPISNFYRSPEMSDSIEFSIDISTSMETIGQMKAKIKAYLESKPQHWRPSHSVQVKEIEDVNKMKMVLYVNHTINFQNAGDRGNRRSDLVLEMKKIFEELGIKYHLLPQEVRVSYIGTAASAFASPTPKQ